METSSDRLDALIKTLIALLRDGESISKERLAQLIRATNNGISEVSQHNSKKKALLYYLSEKRACSDNWQSWNIDRDLDELIMRTLQVKPRRTASGVATITVVTKPAPCASNCLYCPSDIRMPKSYLTDEPACQRAERNFFDPYLQVVSRLKALTEMGHATDKVELIILGGSWSDYAPEYQLWFITELFRALNDAENAPLKAKLIRESYAAVGLEQDPEILSSEASDIQQQINDGKLSYNDAYETLYARSDVWRRLVDRQRGDMDELELQQRINETAQHRVVGLVVETRPDTVSVESLRLLRRLGCTKVQIGVQSLDEDVISLNRRVTKAEDVSRAFALLRLFGFKIHAHFMLNLYGSNPERDKLGYRVFMEHPSFKPDEVKLYPCVLVEGTGLEEMHREGSWVPYDDEELVELLASLVLMTPEHARISRMIRDISAHDIKAGSKKTNLRQRVEDRVFSTGQEVREIRLREVSTTDTDAQELSLKISSYETSVSKEFFLQWLTDEGCIAGFLRLSLPDQLTVSVMLEQGLPIQPKEAMIREVHVYGRAARLHTSTTGPQHKGLGKRLVEAAFEIARDEGFEAINVISAVGTREYYRNLGFEDAGLYLKARVDA